MTRATLCLALLLAAVTPLQAQVPQDLARPKPFRALRLASTDPNGRNADCRRIGPGETLPLGQIEGAGRITHMWFTIASRSPDHLRELVLRLPGWRQQAGHRVPAGRFLRSGLRPLCRVPQCSHRYRCRQGFNCYWPMPFAKGARLTMTNEGKEPVDCCYFNIDYRLDDQPARDIRYFHTQYRQAFPTPKGKDYLILETTGKGHFVGTFLSVMANSDGWWGEGNDKFYVDGADKPTIEGTGSEDYFCGAWDFGHAFFNPYNGVPLYDNPRKGGEKRGILNTCYRWHIVDPVPFTKSLVFTIQHGRNGGDNDRKPLRNNYASVAYYYRDCPEGEGAALPPYKERVPHLLPLPETGAGKPIIKK